MLIKHNLISGDGLSIEVYSTPMLFKKTVIFLNNFTLRYDIVLDLAHHFYNDGFNFVTWHTRGSPGPYRENFRAYDEVFHAEDLAAIINIFEINDCVLIGWCGSCKTALCAASRIGCEVKSILLISGYYGFSEPLLTQDGRLMVELAETLANNEGFAEFYFDVLSNENGKDSGEGKSFANRLALQFKSDAGSLVRWAYLQNNLNKIDVSQWCKNLQLPVHLLGGDQDKMISPADMRKICAYLPKAEMHIESDFDHYSFLTTNRGYKILRDLAVSAYSPSLLSDEYSQKQVYLEIPI